MAKLGTVALVGSSGKQYTFDIYNLNSSWNAVPVVYVVTRTHNDATAERHSIIYIGQTDNLKERFSNHHKQQCFDRNSANRLCLMIEQNENTRLYVESDLIANYSTPCNG